MSDTCSQCNKLFNLTKSRPITLECTCIWCLECINFNLQDNPKREIYCPLDKEVNTMPVPLKESKLVLRKLQSLDQLTIFCEDHEGQIANLYCTDCSIPVCAHCKLDTHKVHPLTELKQSNFKIYTNNVVKLLDEYSFENMKSKLIQLSTNESQVNSSQFKETIKKVHRMLGVIVSEEESQKIDLAHSLEDPLYNPQNRIIPQRSNMAEEQKTQSNLNLQTIQQLINDSQSKMREEFKQTLEAFESNQNQINNQNNESINQIKTAHDNQDKAIEEYKNDVQSNLSLRCDAIENALEKTNQETNNLNQTCNQLQELQNDYVQKQQLLQNQLDKTQQDLATFILTIKQEIEKHDTLLVDTKSQIQNERAMLDTLQLKIQEVNDCKSNNSSGLLFEEIQFKSFQLFLPNISIINEKLNNVIKKANNQIKDDKELMACQVYWKQLMICKYRQLVDIEIQKQQTSLLQTQISDYSSKQFKLLYRGSRDDILLKVHELCDIKGILCVLFLVNTDKYLEDLHLYHGNHLIIYIKVTTLHLCLV
eukprot:403369753